MKGLFDTGIVLITPWVKELYNKYDFFEPYNYIERHIQWDWGEVDIQDAKQNDIAVSTFQRILSVYSIWYDKFWVITEADRGVTTVLLPSEY